MKIIHGTAVRRAIAAASVLTAVSLAGVTGKAAYASGIPVVDASAVAQQIIQVKHMVTQIQEMKNQLDTAKKELESISGSRGLANLINSAYDTGLDVDIDSILASEGLEQALQYGLDSGLGEIFNTQNANAAKWLGQSQAALKQAQDRFGELSGLIAKVNSSPDQKDILDLQARIEAESVMLLNESLKIAMMQSQAEARRQVAEQQMRQRAVNSVGNPADYGW